MRKAIKLPRIIKINSVINHSISVVFNNGESRVIDFHKIFEDLKITEGSAVGILLDPEEFQKVELSNNTLSWGNVDQYITGKGGQKIRVPFEIGADVLLKYSRPEPVENVNRVGDMVKEARKKSGLSQQELALMSGTSRTYISRIENNKSDIELATLRKIIETGLGKTLEIVIK